MPKFIKRTHDNEPNQSLNIVETKFRKIKRNIKLFERRNCFCCNQGPTSSTNEEQEEISNLNKHSMITRSAKRQRDKKMIQKELLTNNTEISTEQTIVLTSHQNKNNNKTEYNEHSFHIARDKYNGKQNSNNDMLLNEISQPIDCTTFFHCNSNMVSCNECSSTFSCYTELKYHKEEVHRTIYTGPPTDLKQHNLRNRRRKSNSLIKKGKEQQIIETTCNEKICEYFQGKQNSEETLNNVNVVNTVHKIVSNQKDVIALEKAHTNNISMIQKSQKITQQNDYINSPMNTEIFHQLESNNKEYDNEDKINNIELHNKIQFSCIEEFDERTYYRNCYDEENQMVLPNICKEKFLDNTTLKEHVYKNQDHNTLIPTNRKRKSDELEEKNLTNSLQKRLKRKSRRTKQRKESQKNVACNNLNRNASEMEILESKDSENKVLSKFNGNISKFSSGNCDEVEKSNTSTALKITPLTHETVFEHNMQMATHFYSKSLYCNKAVETCHQKYPVLNLMLQQKGPYNFENEHLQHSSVLETEKNPLQIILQRNHKNTVNISMVHEEQNKHEVNKSSETKQLEKKTRGKQKRKVCNNGKQYERNVIKTVQARCFKKVLTEGSISNTSVINKMQRGNKKQSKNNIAENKDLILAKNCVNSSKLVVALTKLEDLHESELSQLLVNPKYIENKTRNYEKNVTEMQYSIHKQSFKYESTAINKSTKRNLKSKSTQKCIVKKNHIFKESIEETNLKNTNSDSNILKVTQMKQCSMTKSVHQKVNDNQITLNMPLKETNTNEKNHECSTISNIRKSEKHIKNNKNCEQSAYICNVCSKKYKRRGMYLRHTLMHNINFDTEMHTPQKVQECLKDENVLQLESSRPEDLFKESTQGYLKNNENNNELNSITSNTDLGQTYKTSTSEAISYEMSNAENENEKYANVENISLKREDTIYKLHINLVQKKRNPTKKEELIKLHINLEIKHKVNNNGQQCEDNQIKEDISSQRDKEETIICTKKERNCNICGKKFNSERMLKQHIFYLHDSILENSNLCKQNNNGFKKKYTVRNDGKITKLHMDDNKANQEIMFDMCSMDKMDEKKCKKWRCNVCKENFAFIRNYLRHRYYCHNDESVVHICDNCNKILTSVAMVNIHTCSNVTSWNCKRCNLNFTSGVSLAQHNIDSHFEGVGPHICNICELSFLTTYMLQKHKSTHLNGNNTSSANNSVDMPIAVGNDLPHKSNSVKVLNTEFSKLSISNNKANSCDNTNTNTKHLRSLNEVNAMFKKANTTSSVIFLPYDDEEVLKCKLCHIICLTKLQMKLHLERWHSITTEMCQLCNDPCVLDKLIEHLVKHHIVWDNLSSVPDFQNDIIKLLGFKRLLSLYEYQKYDAIPENKEFNCTTCTKEFSSIYNYKIHHLQCHDMICLLCNIEFKHSSQAYEHKVKIHMSVNSYLWVVQKIIMSILGLNKYGNTIEDVISHFREKEIHDDSAQNIEIRTAQNVSWEDYKFENEDASAKLLYTVGIFKNLLEPLEVESSNILIVDNNNSKPISKI